MGLAASPPAQCAPRDSVHAGSERCPAIQPALEQREFQVIPTTFPARPSDAYSLSASVKPPRKVPWNQSYYKRYDHYISKRMPVCSVAGAQAGKTASNRVPLASVSPKMRTRAACAARTLIVVVCEACNETNAGTKVKPTRCRHGDRNRVCPRPCEHAGSAGSRNTGTSGRAQGQQLCMIRRSFTKRSRFLCKKCECSRLC